MTSGERTYVRNVKVGRGGDAAHVLRRYRRISKVSLVETRSDARAFHAERDPIIRRVRNLPMPETIRSIREKLGLSQRKASELLGGGPRAFQKYESGECLPSAAIANLLWLLDCDPDLIEILARPRSW